MGKSFKKIIAQSQFTCIFIILKRFFSNYRRKATMMARSRWNFSTRMKQTRTKSRKRQKRKKGSKLMKLSLPFLPRASRPPILPWRITSVVNATWWCTTTRELCMISVRRFLTRPDRLTSSNRSMGRSRRREVTLGSTCAPASVTTTWGSMRKRWRITR